VTLSLKLLLAATVWTPNPMLAPTLMPMRTLMAVPIRMLRRMSVLLPRTLREPTPLWVPVPTPVPTLRMTSLMTLTLAGRRRRADPISPAAMRSTAALPVA